MNDLLGPLNDIDADSLTFRLCADYREYKRGADRMRSMWNIPSAREEAGRCLLTDNPWREFDESAPLECRCVGYWRDVASWIFSALTEGLTL